MARPAGLDACEFERLFASLESATGLLAAVSGGPDSLALMHGLAGWRSRSARPPVSVATVDHGLRPEAAAEAAWVAAAAGTLGLPHSILRWEGVKPASGIQEAAREARYALLRGEARRIGASHIVTAHTRTDQAETVLLRLAAGSGPSGLAGMRPATIRDGIVIARPLLDCSRDRLLATCREAGLTVLHDPSNDDPRFARPRLRRAGAVLAAEGLTEARLARLARRLARDDEALTDLAAQALAAARLPSGLQARQLFEAPPALSERAMDQALRERGARYRLERLEELCAALRAACAQGRALTRTLGGIVLRLDERGILSFHEEPARGRDKPCSECGVAGPPHSLGKGDAHA